jgi:hypothetical protein
MSFYFSEIWLNFAILILQFNRKNTKFFILAPIGWKPQITYAEFYAAFD